MIPNTSDMLLRESIPLFDNVASSGDCSGRLSASLEIGPSPRIVWGFESLGNSACEPQSSKGVLENPFLAEGFNMPKPLILRQQWGGLGGPARVFFSGVANEVIYGDPSRRANSFQFILPNARFVHTNLTGQLFIEKSITVRGLKPKRYPEGGTEGRLLQASLDENWRIELDTRSDALEWLNPNRNNSGTLLTTVGVLYSRKTRKTKAAARKLPRRTIAIDTALRNLTVLGILLSFANGGRVAPIFVRALSSAKAIPYSCKIIPFRTTPLELLGGSWLTIDSDLRQYVEGIGVLLRMADSPHWMEALPLVMEWYFQAIQPESAQSRGKPWPVVANALGTALERLSHSIVVREFNTRGLSSATERIETLLTRMGLTRARGFSDVEDVAPFIGVRNDATHPRPSANISASERNRLLVKAVQWVEESLLWRLGYAGKYRDRSREVAASIKPRYDLKTRLSNW